MAVLLEDYEGTWEEIAARAAEFKDRRLRLLVFSDPAESPSLTERRAILRLPLAERRRILAEQADLLAKHYEGSTEWHDLLEGDVVEY